LEMQPKLLRVLEEKEFERVGGTSLIRSNFRLIAASNQNLEEMLNAGRFRRDLYYRLNVIPLQIPPVRERRDDILPIAHYCLEQLSEESSLSAIKIDPQAEEALCKYDWPGNVRELFNLLERVLSSLDGDTIRLADLPFYVLKNKAKSPDSSGSSLRGLQAKAEKEAIQDALLATNYNKARAASMLGIHRTLLYKKIRKHKLPLRKGGTAD
jgi:transcriptional regulator with PAS, ATPase and Fis domain